MSFMSMNITVIVHPNSKRPRVSAEGKSALSGDRQVLHIYVSAPPVAGRANEAVISALAEHFGVKKYQVRLLKGTTSKQKLFSIS